MVFSSAIALSVASIGIAILMGAKGRAPLRCEKHLALGTGVGALDALECQRRLKRWYIMGNAPLVEDAWHPQWKRRHHVFEYGGSRLHHLASDNAGLNPLCGANDDELDQLCRDA